MQIKTGLGSFRWLEDWVKIPPTEGGQANGRTHGVVVSRAGDIYIFHQAAPSVLVYDPAGRLLNRWGNYPGAHGMTLVEENGEEFLWLVDEQRLVAEKATLDGRIVQTLAKPDHPAYAEGRYVPTWVAVDEVRHGGRGDIWLADGYGQSLVHHYDTAGRYLATLDGTEGAGRFRCPHGIAFDTRKGSPELYVADRGNRRVQVYDPEGRFKRTFGAEFLTSPDMFAFLGKYLLVPELTARLSILDQNDALAAQIGLHDEVAQRPGWPNNREWVVSGKFNSPHAATADAAGNIYVVEWITGGRVTKLEALG